MSKVFISHKNSDSTLAEKVSSRVKKSGLTTYLDTIDDALLKDGPTLADHLLARMSGCNQLIAVVSIATKSSWWVPWEIGVGSEKGFRMASYSQSYVDLPSYLEKWPDLHSNEDIDLFCNLSKQADRVVSRRTRTFLNEAQKMTVLKAEATDFHKKLLSELANKRK